MLILDVTVPTLSLKQNETEHLYARQELGPFLMSQIRGKHEFWLYSSSWATLYAAASHVIRGHWNSFCAALRARCHIVQLPAVTPCVALGNPIACDIPVWSPYTIYALRQAAAPVVGGWLLQMRKTVLTVNLFYCSWSIQLEKLSAC